MSSTISVIVPAHNAAQFIEDCLRAAMPAAEALGAEVIVVDDASTDDTSRLAESFGVRTVRHERSLGAAAARNHGAQLARGEILVFVDSDVVLPDDTLRKLVDRLRQSPSIHATGAHASPRNLSPNWSAHFVGLRHSQSFYCQPRRDIVGLSCFQSECGAIRRDVFEHVGGFPEKYDHAGMEDYQFGHEMERLGYVNVLLADAEYDHHYRPLLPRCREIMRRTARWLPLAVRRRRFESQGMGGSWRESASFLLTVMILAGTVAGFLHPAGSYLAGGAACLQLAWEWRFLRFAYRHCGLGMALYAWPALQIFHGAILLGLTYGALRVLTLRSQQNAALQEVDLKTRQAAGPQK